MTTHIALLPDRALIDIDGDDAKGFLQGLLTCDMEKVSAASAQAGALLTPQGKILFDVVVAAEGGAYLLETAADQRDALIKRLAFYKLRAKVRLTPRDDLKVYVLWGDAATQGFTDPRWAALDKRFYAAEFAANADASTYHAHRILQGIPEAGKDYQLGDTFPHEANFDLLHGVDFEKGCYVGQEVVSRMQHRGTARKRILPFELSGPALPRTPISAGDQTIGEVGSSSQHRALALVRIDKLEDALSNKLRIMAGEAELTPVQPAWANFTIAGSAA